MQNEWLNLLDHYFHPDIDRKGERNIDCPLCGKPTVKGQHHFSYSERGGYCFVCGGKTSLQSLCKRLGLTEGSGDKYLPAPVYAPVAKPQRQIAQWTNNTAALALQYARHPKRTALWQAHKPLSHESIERYGLGVGVLPNCACKHERLIIPIRQNGEIATFFGRALTCDCTKWLPPGGASVTRWLFGLDDIQPDRTIWIVENKADAILLRQHYPDYIALSPSAISVRDEWHDWAEQIKAMRPQRVFVAFDNDLAGNGGGANRLAWLSLWRDDMKQRQPDLWRKIQAPPSAGIWLTKFLARQGLPTSLFHYPPAAPHKASVADLLTQKEKAA